MTTPPNFEPVRQETSLRDVVAIFFRRLRGMAVIFAVSMAVVLFWMFVIRTDVYEATAKILVRLGYEQAPSVTVMDRQTSSLGYRHQDVATEVHILSSTDIIAQVVDEMSLDRAEPPSRPTRFFAGLVHDVRRVVARVREWSDELLIRVGLRERLSPREQVIHAIQRGLQVGSSQESNVVVAALRLPHRRGVAPVLDAILDEYLAARVHLFQEQDALDLFRASMSRSLEELRDVEAAIKKLESESNIVDIAVQKKLLLEQQEKLGQELEIELAEVETIGGKLAALRTLRASEAPDFGRLGAFPQGSFAADRMSELARLEKERIRLESTAGGRDQRALEENRRSLQMTLSLLESNIDSLLGERRAAAEARRQARDSVREQIAALQERETAWRELRRRSELLENEYRFYRHEAEKAAATTSMQDELIGNVTVIQHPIDPVQPTGPRKLHLLVIAAVLCAALAVAWAALAEFLDHRIQSASQASAWLGVPVAAVVARLAPLELERALGRGARDA